jgi:hypothetical protein
MRMYKFLIILLIVLASTGCSKHYHPLDANKKARLVSELVTDSPQCDALKQQLLSPTVDDDAIDDIFHAAMKAHCIKKDV